MLVVNLCLLLLVVCFVVVDYVLLRVACCALFVRCFPHLVFSAWCFVSVAR